MEFTLYRCRHCGNVAYKLIDSGIKMVCCDEEMGELIPNVTEGAYEKHIPSIKIEDGKATITIGSVIHPMEEKHYIQFIAADSGDTVTIKHLKPGQMPVLEVKAEGLAAAYELCNIHGYWKGEK